MLNVQSSNGMMRFRIWKWTNLGPSRWALVVLVLGLFLRLFQLGEWSFWHDEALTVLLARKSVADLVRITGADVHPPLYFVLVKAFLGLGQSEFIVRLPSALCSTGSIVLLYLLGRDLFDARTGLVSAAITAFSPLQLYYAQEARMYMQLMLLTVFCSWCLMRALRTGRVLWWGLFVLGATLACYTAYFVFPVLLAMLLYVVLVDRERKSISGILFSMGIVLAFYLPWMGVLVSQTRAIADTYWMERPHLLMIFTTLCAFFVGYSLSQVWTVVALVAALFMIFVVLNSVRHSLVERRPDAEALVWLLLWGLVPLLGTYAVSLVRPIFQIRTVMTAAPAFYLLVGWGLTRVRRRRTHWILFMPTLLIMAVSAWNFYFDPAFSKPAWRQAALYVNEHAQDGDVAIHTSEGSFLTFLCYEHHIEHTLLPEDPDTAQKNAPSQQIVAAVASPSQPIDRAVRGHKRAWVVVGLDHAVEHQISQKEQFDARYPLLVEDRVGGVLVYLYQLE